MDTLILKNNEQQLILIAVEHNNHKRYFLRVTLDKLLKLLYNLEVPKRTLYEISCAKRICIVYLDVGIHIEKSLIMNVQESLSILQKIIS